MEKLGKKIEDYKDRNDPTSHIYVDKKDARRLDLREGFKVEDLKGKQKEDFLIGEQVAKMIKFLEDYEQNLK